MMRKVVVVGYTDECGREKGMSPQVKRVVETHEHLESVAKELYEQDLWLAYTTTEGRRLASIKDARTFLGGH